MAQDRGQWASRIGFILAASGSAAREEGFKTSNEIGKIYWGWVFLLRYIVPIAVFAVFLHAIGII